jgi:hypothetical protein
MSVDRPGDPSGDVSGDDLELAFRAARATIEAARAETAALRERAAAAERRADAADVARSVAQVCAARAEAERDLERQRADALRSTVEELRAGQVLMAQTYSYDPTLREPVEAEDRLAWVNNCARCRALRKQRFGTGASKQWRRHVLDAVRGVHRPTLSL